MKTEKKILGKHCCPDWDYDCIYPDTPEWECCTCNKYLPAKYPSTAQEKIDMKILPKDEITKVVPKEDPINDIMKEWERLQVERDLLEKIPETKKAELDPGAHYRYQYKGINLDPFRIGSVYGISNFAQLTVLKKILCTGNRGHKDLVQDINDCICALERWKEMLEEDKELETGFVESNLKRTSSYGTSFDFNEIG